MQPVNFLTPRLRHRPRSIWRESQRTGRNTYVPGHGDLFTKDDLRTKLLIIQDRWEKMKAIVAQGKSLDDVKTELGESTEPPKRNAQGNLPPPTTTEIMYSELTRKE
jgi:hypothetical protein